MQGPLPLQQADQILDEYPSQRQRAHAIRCLGWIACKMRATGMSELAWWKVPDLAPPRQIWLTRRLVMCAVLAVDAAVVIAVTSWGWALIFLALLIPALIGGGRNKRRRSAGRRRPPRATVPRWPGWGGLARILLYTAGTVGLLFFPSLLSMWSVSAEERPAAASYRADRLSDVLYGLACAPAGAFLGTLAFSPAYGSPGWLAGTLRRTDRS